MNMTFGALAHLIVSLAVILAVILLAAWGKITGDVALITSLAVAGISAPSQLLTTTTKAVE